jgi:hypothetical protein
VVEPRDDHGDGGDQKMIKCFTFRKKRKTKSDGNQGKGIARVFSFGDQDTIEGVITFRINSRTMKRGVSRLKWFIECH